LLLRPVLRNSFVEDNFAALSGKAMTSRNSSPSEPAACVSFFIGFLYKNKNLKTAAKF